jgi:hypothetical protein
MGGLSTELPGVPITDLQLSNARAYVTAVTVLLVLSSSLVAIRVTSRWKSLHSLTLDVFFIVAAALSGLINWAVSTSSMTPILSSDDHYVPMGDFSRLAPLSVAAELTSTWAVAWIKTSVAFLLMRLQPTPGWRYFCYAMLIIQFATATFTSIMHTTRCVPIEAVWTPSITDKRCWGTSAFKTSLTVTSVVVILTDVIFSLMPLTFLHHIRASHRDRIVIGILMALGLFASAASVVKTVYVHRFDEGGDFPGKGLSICLWGSIEVQVGIIVACIPCLRSVFLRFLGRIGIHTGSSPAPCPLPDSDETALHPKVGGLVMQTFVGGSGRP